MRKLSLLLVVAMLVSLSACSFLRTQSSGIGKSDYKEEGQMLLDALSAGDLDAAVALMHPDVKKDANMGLHQIAAYLSGRKVVSMEQMRINKQSNTDLQGTASLEQAGFDLKLDDGSVCSVSLAYLKDSAGEGFSSVQLILGVV